LLRGGIIGLGAIGSKQDEEKKKDGVYSHAGAYKSLDGFELVAACDVNEERLKAFSAFWGVEVVYNNIEELLSRDSLDAISICTPDNTHYSILKQILRSPGKLKAVIMEKPFALTLQECLDLERLAENSSVFITVNNQRRVEPSHLKIAEMLRSGSLGRIQAVSAYYVKGLFHIGCTMIDTLRMLLGEVEWVAAIPGEPEVSDDSDRSVDFILGFDNTCQAVVQACDKDGYCYSIFEIDILCSKGRLKIQNNGFDIFIQHVEEYPIYPGFRSLGVPESITGNMSIAMSYMFRNVLDSVLSGKVGLSDFAKEAIRDIAILDMIRESGKQNGKSIQCK